MRLRDPFLENQVATHRKSYDRENIRDYTDALIKVLILILEIPQVRLTNLRNEPTST